MIILKAGSQQVHTRKEKLYRFLCLNLPERYDKVQ